MPTKYSKKIFKCCADILIVIISIYRLIFKPVVHVPSKKAPLRVILLINRRQDVELLIGIYNKAKTRDDLLVVFWLRKKFGDTLLLLQEKGVVVDQLVSPKKLLFLSKVLLQADAFLSTVENSSSADKLPHILTKLANAAGVSTYMMQHGFETVGLSYRDKFHGSEVKFKSKTVLTWGAVDKLPSWVGADTLEKAIAVGHPQKLMTRPQKFVVDSGERPIIGIFDNLHWHRYDEKYRLSFIQDLKQISEHRKEFHFIFKSHPVSVRKRGSELADALKCMENIDVVDLLGEEGTTLTTPWLLSHSLGVITTPSTIALDGALAEIPVAVTRYGLDLNYYSPLTLLDNLEDWQKFLDQLTEKTKYTQLKLNAELFLKHVLVPGDSANKILNLMVENHVKKISST